MMKMVSTGNDEEYTKLLDERNKLMETVDALKAAEPGFQYSSKAKQYLEKTLKLDQEMSSLMNNDLNAIQKEIKQMELKRQITSKYRPYYKQTNGAFIDSKN
ncbi:flagellar protein FliT [Neobacillus sp. OS1-32]|nr:flagellar protein FliT [Neobacillus sp. OS1-32]WML31535.1 flagellar protein FliT [Neobacillus sp. OS1-32]